MSWQVALSSSAIRDLDRMPPRIVPAVVEFVFGPLASDPTRVGKSLRDDFVGEWGARRGSYRVLYSLDRDNALVIVTRVGHRADVYRPR